MTPQQEAAFEKKAEQHFKGHRELPNGKNFTCWNREHSKEAEQKYKQNFDKIFPNSPGVGF